MKPTNLPCWLNAAGLIVVVMGCRSNVPGTIPAPLSQAARPAAYYSPNSEVGATANSATGPLFSATPTITLAPEGVSTTAATSRNTFPRDTVQVGQRTPQDDQPIRIPERSTTNPTFSAATATRGMTVNDGTSATTWGQATRASNAPAFGHTAQPQAGISMAGLRGVSTGTEKPAALRVPSGSNSQWRPRTANEAGIQR